MQEKFCDLHMHSVFSDGSHTPEELIELALSAGLCAVALTDHNTVDGCERFLSAADSKPIDAVCGAELTTDYEGTELHLLGLFLAPEVFDDVSEYVVERNIAKESANKKMIERLAADGFEISYGEFVKRFPNRNRNRANIGALLQAKGYVASVSEAFEKYLDEGQKYYVHAPRLDFLRTIGKIHEWGGVAVWAHPLYHVDRVRTREILTAAMAYGLDGAEAYYSTYSEDDTAYMLALCRELEILPSGGSDFHGAAKPDIAIGKGNGSLAVPYSCYENLKKLAKKYKSAQKQDFA